MAIFQDFQLSLPEPLVREFVLKSLPSEVESPFVALLGGKLSIAGKVRRFGFRIPFRLDLVPDGVVWRPKERRIVFRVARFKPLDTDWMVNYALKDLQGRPGIAYRDRRLMVDIEGLLARLPGWKGLPEPLKQVVKLKAVRIPEEGGRLTLVLGP